MKFCNLLFRDFEFINWETDGFQFKEFWCDNFMYTKCTLINANFCRLWGNFKTAMYKLCRYIKWMSNGNLCLQVHSQMFSLHTFFGNLVDFLANFIQSLIDLRLVLQHEWFDNSVVDCVSSIPRHGRHTPAKKYQLQYNKSNLHSARGLNFLKVKCMFSLTISVTEMFTAQICSQEVINYCAVKSRGLSEQFSNSSGFEVHKIRSYW